MSVPPDCPALQLSDLLPALCSGLTPQDLPAAWRAHSAERPGGAVHLHYERHANPQGMDLRFMRLWSAKVDVQTLFVYPAPACVQPVLAAETVWLGGKAQILVLDTPWLCPAPAAPTAPTTAATPACALPEPANPADPASRLWADQLQALRACHQLVNSSDTPAWYADCRSGHDVFLRPENALVATQFGQYALAAAALCQLAWASPASLHAAQTQAHSAALAHYRQHHHAHSPGVPLMSRCFGPDWSYAFMAAFFG